MASSGPLAGLFLNGLGTQLNVARWLLPTQEVDGISLKRGMRLLVWDAVCGQTMLVLTTGAFIAGFALMLGASNTTIGLLAAVGPLAQVLQSPAVYLIERIRRRKALAVFTLTISRAAWLLIAFLPWLFPPQYALPVLVAALFVFYGFGNIGGCSFNSWIRDLVPDTSIAPLFAKRMTWATGIGAVISLGGGFMVDGWKALGGQAAAVYALIFLTASATGLLGVGFLAATPEPEMPVSFRRGILRTLKEPFLDDNFRKLLAFLSAWNFAANFALPFFSVYMLERAGLSMSWVLGMTVLSQMVNVLFFPIWGRLANRFSNKSVMAASGPLYILSFLLWPLSAMPEPGVMTLPVLTLIHMLIGISTAGVNLCANNLALKLAPFGKGGTYLAVNATLCGIAASVAPALAGSMADWLDAERLTVSVQAVSSAARHADVTIRALSLHGLDYVFLVAFVLGVYSLYRLSMVREAGAVRERVVWRALMTDMHQTVQLWMVSAGLRPAAIVVTDPENRPAPLSAEERPAA